MKKWSLSTTSVLSSSFSFQLLKHCIPPYKHNLYRHTWLHLLLQLFNSSDLLMFFFSFHGSLPFLLQSSIFFMNYFMLCHPKLPSTFQDSQHAFPVNSYTFHMHFLCAVPFNKLPLFTFGNTHHTKAIYYQCLT